MVEKNPHKNKETYRATLRSKRWLTWCDRFAFDADGDGLRDLDANCTTTKT